MINGKFIATLTALIAVVFAICNINSNSVENFQGFGMLRARPTLQTRQPLRTTANANVSADIRYAPPSEDNQAGSIKNYEQELEEVENKLERVENELERVYTNRIMNSVKRSRNSAHGDYIRGDLNIPRHRQTDQYGMETVLSGDTHSNNQKGAMHILTDVQNHNMCNGTEIMSQGYYGDINVVNNM